MREVRLTFRAKSPRTRTTYATGLNAFEQFLQDAAIDHEAATTGALPPDCLEQFYLWLVDRQGRANTATINTYMSSARAFLRYLARRDLAPQISLERSLEQVREVAVKSVYRAPRVPSNLALIVDFADHLPLPEPGSGDPQVRLRVLRDRALLNTAYGTGMRREEVVSLNRRDVADGRLDKIVREAQRAVRTGRATAL